MLHSAGSSYGASIDAATGARGASLDASLGGVISRSNGANGNGCASAPSYPLYGSRAAPAVPMEARPPWKLWKPGCRLHCASLAVLQGHLAFIWTFT